MQKYGGKIPDSVRKTYAKQGVYFGDDPRNLIPADPKQHSGIHSQYNKLDASLKKLNQLAKQTARGPAFRSSAAIGYLGYAAMFDEMTGGHVDQAINNGVDQAKAFAVHQLQRLVNAHTSSKPSVSGSNTDYGQ